MTDPLEIELKLQVRPEDQPHFDSLAVAMDGLAGAQPPQSRDLVSTYFDTPDLALRAAGFSLRIRQSGDRLVQTVKFAGDAASAGLFIRPEWERTVAGPTPVLDEKDGPLLETFDKETLGRISPLFASVVSRTIRIVEAHGSRIELAIDRGEVRAGDASESLFEIELELQDGQPGALFDLAREIEALVPVRLGVRSKSERGYDMVSGGRRPVSKAEPPSLEAEGDAGAAFVAIANACIRQFRLNEDLLLETGEARALHQARVGLRRLRSAFSLFKPLLAADPDADRLRAELRWLAGELGEVRNLDVLIGRCEGQAVRDQLITARAEAFDRVRGELESARARLLMIDLVEWLAIGAWRTVPAGIDIATFAADLLDTRRRRLKRKGRKLATLDDHRRHQVRIEAKKLRYSVEFFAGLFAGSRKRVRRHKAFLGALEEMQDALGDLNDLATGQDVFATLGIEAPPPILPVGSRKHLLKQAGEAYESWVDTKRFWR